jgi:hypothetical protein
MLASREVGRKETTEGFQNGTGGGGQIYRFDHQRVVGSLIPWVQSDPTPQVLRAAAKQAGWTK